LRVGLEVEDKQGLVVRVSRLQEELGLLYAVAPCSKVVSSPKETSGTGFGLVVQIGWVYES